MTTIKSDEIESFVSKKVDSGLNRNDVIFETVLEFRIKPNEVDKILKKLKISFTKSRGYREWTVSEFKKNPDLTFDEWIEGIGEFLENTKNYRQLYPMLKSLALGLEEMED